MYGPLDEEIDDEGLEDVEEEDDGVLEDDDSWFEEDPSDVPALVDWLDVSEESLLEMDEEESP